MLSIREFPQEDAVKWGPGLSWSVQWCLAAYYARCQRVSLAHEASKVESSLDIIDIGGELE